MPSANNFQKCIASVTNALPADLSSELCQQWIDNPSILANVLRRSLMTFPLTLSPLFPGYMVTVDNNLSVEQLTELGKYNDINDYVSTINYPTSETGVNRVEMFIITFLKCLYINDIVIEIEKLGYRSANVKELLSLGAQYPNLQKKKAIMAPGAIWKDKWNGVWMPRLDMDRIRHPGNQHLPVPRELGVRDYFSLFSGDFDSFAVVKK